MNAVTLWGEGHWDRRTAFPALPALPTLLLLLIVIIIIMEVNKDEALRCLEIARRHLGAGNFTSARKFGQKSISLYPTPEAKAFISRVDSYEAAASNSGTASSASAASPSSSTSSAPASTSRRSADATPAKPRAAPAPVEREYTTEQAAAVKVIRSSGGDFYKVLGLQKGASDIEIKKAYRKVLAMQKFCS